MIVPRPGVRTAFNSSTPYFSLLDISLDRAEGSTILVVSDGFDYGVVRFSERTIAEEGIANGDSEHEIGEPARKKRPVKISRATRMCKTKYSYRCFHVILPRLLSLDLGFARNTILQRTIKSRTSRRRMAKDPCQTSLPISSITMRMTRIRPKPPLG